MIYEIKHKDGTVVVVNRTEPSGKVKPNLPHSPLNEKRMAEYRRVFYPQPF